MTNTIAQEIIYADCVNYMQSYTGQKPTAIFCDPPFNIKQQYLGYFDKLSDTEYELWCHTWIKHAADMTSGVLMLHGPDKLVDIYVSAAKDLGLRRIAWINWHYNFGQCSRRNWIDARCHCLIYAKDAYVWNPEAVLVDSERKRIGDKRIHHYKNGGQRVPGTVWGIKSDGPFWGRVQGTNKERWRQHPNQLPIVYIGRLVKAYTNHGDLVFDPFCGSGTVPLVCKALGRQCIAVDISIENVASASARLNSFEQTELALNRLI